MLMGLHDILAAVVDPEEREAIRRDFLRRMDEKRKLFGPCLQLPAVNLAAEQNLVSGAALFLGLWDLYSGFHALSPDLL